MDARRYRAPELWAPEVGDAVDARADVWAVGALGWAVAFGLSPFESELAPGRAAPRVVECSHSRARSPVR